MHACIIIIIIMSIIIIIIILIRAYHAHRRACGRQAPHYSASAQP